MTKAAGNHLYYVEYPSSTAAEIPARSVDAGEGGERNGHDDPDASASAAANTNTTTNTNPPTTTKALTQLTPRFRNTIYLKRGSFVVVDTSALAERSNKLGGEIVNVVREERSWRKMWWWPGEFAGGRVGGEGREGGAALMGSRSGGEDGNGSGSGSDGSVGSDGEDGDGEGEEGRV